LLVLFLVAAMGLMAAQVGVVWQQVAQRDREAELLAIGVEMARALASYKRAGSQKIYPTKLADVVEDKRFPNPVRHLRRIYRDPFSGEPRWGLVLQAGQITGVYSFASGEPIRRSDLPPELGDAAKNAKTYADWVFKPTDPNAPVQGPGGDEGAPAPGNDDGAPAPAAPAPAQAGAGAGPGV
jgi:hypothetical protein